MQGACQVPSSSGWLSSIGAFGSSNPDVGSASAPPGFLRALKLRPGYHQGMLFSKKSDLPSADRALPGRPHRMTVPSKHFVLGTPLIPPFPGKELAIFAMGCFWGVERKFWEIPGVYSTSVGYSGGFTPNPTYEEVCSGKTGHTEAVQVAFDPTQVSYETLLKLFWENHDPTQGMRQGNDAGTQYRSALYTFSPEQRQLAQSSRATFEPILVKAGYGDITTEIAEAKPYYFAEEYHQQYLAKNPNGYCGVGGTGVSCPIGLRIAG